MNLVKQIQLFLFDRGKIFNQNNMHNHELAIDLYALNLISVDGWQILNQNRYYYWLAGRFCCFGDLAAPNFS